MARLSTQPSKRAVTVLRSRFVALPVGAHDFVFARTHDADEAGLTLFVTGLPLGSTPKSIKKTFAPFGSVGSVSLLPAVSDGPTSLAQQQAALASSDSTVPPLFQSDSVSTPSAPSALVVFTSPPSFPPTTKSIAPLPAAPKLASFLTTSATAHSHARPHLSVVIAHSDAWMNAHDLRQAALVPTSYTPAPLKSAASKKKAAKDVGPVPGSAAYALAAHSAAQVAAADRTTNPDEVQEGEWTLVSRGGKHGQSLLPAGATPTLLGYGAVTVGVARKGGKRRAETARDDEDDGEQGIKKIVGEGFYRFTKEDGRRKGESWLACGRIDG